MNKHNIVKKKGDKDKDEIGLVLERISNDLGHSFLRVIKSNGEETIWYEKLCECVCEQK